MIDRIDRLEALLRYDRPDEKLSRAARQAARMAQERRPAQIRWIDEHRCALTGLAAAIVAQAEHYQLPDEDREWIDELAVDAGDAAWTPATMAVLSLAAAELRTTPAIVGLDSRRPHAVHVVLQKVDELRSRFAALGNSS